MGTKVISVTAPRNSTGWLRGLAFDATYIGGIAVLALLAGVLIVLQPRLFPLVLTLDLWMLGYHHVVSTYTRLAFDTESFKNNRFLALWLPLIVLAGVAGLYLVVGSWALTTVYLYWQWFHYMRQSYGIARIYRRKTGRLPLIDERLSYLLLYLFPVWGILYRSYQSPSQFLWMDVKTLPIPSWAVTVVAVLTLTTLVWWCARQVRAFWRDRVVAAHTLYISSHVLIFTVGYLLIEDINHGWLVVNIWHNAQYILLVWMFNNNRFRGGVEAKHRFLSTISQTQNMAFYFLICFAISSILYATLYVSVSQATAALALTGTLPLLLIVYQVINFHHYIVDAVIWKVRKESLKKNLGLIP